MRGSGKFGKARIIPAKSEQSALRERDRLVACDDEMVEHLDLDQRQGLLQVAREELVGRSEEHTSELQSHSDLVCRLLLEKKKKGKLRALTRCIQPIGRCCEWLV